MGKPLRAIGLMSGTSLDGIDVALIETDGENAVRRGPAATFPYPNEFRAMLKRALSDARGLQDRRARPGSLAAAESELTERHAEAVQAFLNSCGFGSSDVNVAGFHGQTVWHNPVGPPPGRVTVQIGDGEKLATLIGIDVVYDLRAADFAAGGQGAPLVPVYHRALAAHAPERPVAVLNIGGVANVTWIGRGGELIAFDTGPGNALIDAWAEQHTGAACDQDGRLAAAGRVDGTALRALLAHPYFALQPPKSLDRNAFSFQPAQCLGAADGAATLTAFTAAAAAEARRCFPEDPRLWIVTGGGRKNRTLMGMLAEGVGNPVVPAETVNLDGSSLEAEAWAYLAVRALEGLPITFPGTTGVPHPMTGGVLARKSAAGFPDGAQ